MPPGRRRRAPILAALTLALLLLVMVGVGFLPQEILRQYVEQRIRGAIGERSSIGRMRVVPGTLTAEAWNLVIEGPSYRLEVPYARMRLKPGFLIGHAMALRFVELERPTLTLWESKTSKPREPLKQPIQIDALSAKNGTIVYREDKLGGDVVLRGVEAAGAIGGIVTLSGAGEWQRDPAVPLQDLAARLRVSEWLDIGVESLTGRVAGSTFSAKGTLGKAGEIRPDLAIQADVDLADARLLPGAPAMTGHLDVDAKLKGTLEGQNLEADVRGSGLVVSGWTLDRLEGRATHDGAKERTDFRAEAHLLGGTAEASGTWATSEAHADLKLRGIDTGPLARQLKVSIPFAGSVDGELTARGNPKETLRVEGTLTGGGRAAEGGRLDTRVALDGTVRPETKAIALTFGLRAQTKGAVGPLPDRVQAADLRAEGRAEGTLTDPRVRGTLRGLVDVRGPRAVEQVPLTGSFRWADSSWAADVEGKALGGTVQAHMDAKGVLQTLEAHGRSIDLARLAPDAQGVLSFDFRGRGRDPLASGTGDAIVSGLVWRDVQAGDVTARLTGGSQVSFAAPALGARGSGRLAKQAFDGQVVLDATRLETFQPLSPQRELAGVVSGQLDVRVPFSDPKAATVDGRLSRLEMRSGTFEAHATQPFGVSWRAGRVAVDNLALVGTGIELFGDASFGTEPGSALRATLRVSADLAKLPWGEGWQVSGLANGDVRLQGTLSRPRADGTLDITEVVMQPPNRPAITARAGRVRLDGEFMSTPGLTLLADGGEVVLDGRLPLSGLLPAATAEKLGLRRDLPIEARLRGHADLSKLPVREGWTLVGDAVGEVTITGLLTRPVTRGELVVRGMSVAVPGHPAVTADETRVVIDGDMVHTTGIALATEAGTLLVSGRLPLAALAPAALAERLQFDTGLPLDVRVHADLDLAKVPTREGWTLVGRAEGDVNVTGTMDRPRAQGELRVQGTTLTIPGRPPVTAQDARVVIEGDTLTTTGLTVSAQNSTVALTGRVPIAALAPEAITARFGFARDLPVDVDLRADLDLRDVPLAEPWSASGRAFAELEVTGPADAVQATGTVRLQGTEVANAGAAVARIDDGAFELRGDVARTDGIVATVAEGTVRLEGTVPLGSLLGPGSRLARLASSGAEADVHLTWQGVQAGALVQVLLPRTSTSLAAALSGEARLQGRLSEPRSLRGSVVQQAATAQVEAVEVALSEVRLDLEAGELRTAQPVTLSSGGGEFQLTSRVDFADQDLTLDGRGRLDIGVFSPFLESASLSGAADMELVVDGPFSGPAVRGGVNVTDGAIRIRELREAITSINGQLSFADGGVMRLENMEAVLGGGPVRMAGTARLDHLTVRDVDVTMSGEDLALRYPVGGTGRLDDRLGDIKTRSDVALNLTGDYGDLLLSGEISVKRALYDVDVFVGSGLFAPEVPPSTSEPSRFLRQIALNVSVELVNPAIVRNNLAQLQATGGMWVRGDADEIAPFGRLELQPGGKVFLQDREFTLSAGSLTYTGTLDPDVNVQAETVIRNVGQEDLTVRVATSGTIDYPRMSLSSTPAMTERELTSLIATGRADWATSPSAWVVGEQAASLLAGRFTRGISRELVDLGFDEVNIQPALLARENEPGARFTFAKDISSRLRFIYSFGLNDPEAQVYAAQFRIRRGMDITARVQRFDDGRLSYGLGQTLRFGGVRRQAAQVTEEPREEVKFVQIPGEPPVAEEELTAGLRSRVGKDVTRFDVLDDADLMRERLVQAGHLGAEVESTLHDGVVTFTVKAGPLHGWRVDGWPEAPDLTPTVYSSLYKEEALENGREFLLRHLHKQGRLRATVRTRELNEGGNRMLVFDVDPGEAMVVTTVEFPGATALTHAELLQAAGGEPALLSNPRQAALGIRRAYNAKQYLAAQVDVPRVSSDTGKMRIVVPIREGEKAVVSAVRFPGATLPAGELESTANYPLGGGYDQLAAQLAVQRLRDRYLTLGYPAVRVVPEIEPVGRDMTIVFRVAEGRRTTVGPVEVVGLRRTREWVVRRQVDLNPGDPLDPRRLAAIERRLLDLGIFSRAVVTAGEGENAPLKIELEEAARHRVAYDLRYDEVEQGSALIDAETGNVFGIGMSVGARYRIGSRLREARGSLHLPSITKLGDLTFGVFRTDEKLQILAEEGLFDAGLLDRRVAQGVEVQQVVRRLRASQVLLGYRYQRDEDTSAFPERETIGALSLSLANDDRVNPFNSRRGLFWSVSLDTGREWLGSDVDFMKGYGILYLTRPLSGPWTWAQGYRLGLAYGLGDPRGSRFAESVSVGQRAERFRAGGPTTLRGFDVDALGRHDVKGVSLGGQAVLILNQEIRWRSEKGFGAAAFYDVGNVWETVRDFGTDLRHTVGVGARYESPVGLLRIDLGVPLDRRQGEDPYRIHVGFGQAF